MDIPTKTCPEPHPSVWDSCIKTFARLGDDNPLTVEKDGRRPGKVAGFVELAKAERGDKWKELTCCGRPTKEAARTSRDLGCLNTELRNVRDSARGVEKWIEESLPSAWEDFLIDDMSHDNENKCV